MRHYFVDEAGDPILFNRRREIIIGREGCSQYFMLGLIDIPNPELLNHELTRLRERLLADPYFKRVPSMQPAARKTALAFHAKDDVQEVRHKVFSLLVQHEMRFFAVVRDKQKILAYVRKRNKQDTAYRYSPNELYDSLVRRLFKERLHKDDGYEICFARRGASDRTIALRVALENARQTFYQKWRIRNDAPISVVAGKPQHSPGLQATDYFLWALQRLYERGEERYLEYIWPRVSLIHDVDDTQSTGYGVYYNQKNPLKAGARAKK